MPRRLPPESIPGAQLVPGPELLRSTGSGPEAARAHLEHCAGLSAYIRLVDSLNYQSLRAPRPSELLRQPKSVQRYSGDGVGKPLPHELGGESGCHKGLQEPYLEVWDADSTDPAFGRLLAGDHQPGVQSGLPQPAGRGARAAGCYESV